MSESNLIKSVQSIKSLSSHLNGSASSQSFNRVTPKNIKLKFMKMGGIGATNPDKKAKVNSSLIAPN